jgi:hypothetical protein
LQLVYAGSSYEPAGVNFCQINASRQRICTESPLSVEGQSVPLIRDSAIQLHIVEGPRPASLTFAFVETSTLQSVFSETRGGDRLYLLNVDVAGGVYFLRVEVSWGDTTATYFFRTRVTG